MESLVDCVSQGIEGTIEGLENRSLLFVGFEQRDGYLDYPTLPDIYKDKMLAQSSTRNGMSK